jgi:prepilin-type N-terminal cleavage/methylation domain-containing protein
MPSIEYSSNPEPQTPNHKPHGFTLVELLLAVALTALIATAVFGTLAAGRDASRRTEVVGELDQIARQALDRIAADFQLVRRPLEAFDTGFVGLDGGEDDPAGARDTADVVTASPLPVPGSPGGPPADLAAAAAGTPATAGADLARVLWAIDEDDATPERGLVRREQRLLTAVTTDLDASLDAVEIAPEAVGLRLRYLGDAGWVDAWDSRQLDALPHAVEIGLTVRLDRHGEIHERSVRTVVRCVFVPILAAETSK